MPEPSEGLRPGMSSHAKTRDVADYPLAPGLR